MTELNNQSSKARIMIVEDEPLVAKDLSMRLTKMQYDVIGVCYEPEIALEMAISKKPDLILMDINLNAKTDGIDVAQAIHEKQDTPVIFCTAYSGKDVLERAKITTPYGYIIKPIDSRELEINIDIALYKHNIEHELHDLNNKLTVALNSIDDAVVVCDSKGQIFLSNPKALEICLWNESMNGLNIKRIMQLKDMDTGVEKVDLDYWLTQGLDCHLNMNQQLSVGHNQEIPIELNVAPLEDRSGQCSGLVFAFRDISRRIYFEQELKKNAFEDPITRLPERSLLFERLKLAFRRKKFEDSYQFALLFIDLDRFRVINEGLGHEFGDEVLRRISARISEQIRDIDMLSRFSGDTFVVLLERIRSTQSILPIVDKIHTEIAKPMTINTHHISLTASSGTVVAHRQYGQHAEILRDADTAMYQAKLKGGDQNVLFNMEMHEHALRFIEIEEELRHAIQDDCIFMNYQPIIKTDTGELKGFEALVRWQHPQKGVISPDEFIQVAEETGLILPLGDQIIEMACHQLAEWNKQYSFRIELGINLSAKQFGQPDLAEKLFRVINHYNIDPTTINIEVTESMAMGNVEETILILNSLRNKGLKVSIDDFGTGYSSLAYLKRFPIQTLKIDRSFIIDILHSSDDQAIVRSTMAMAKELQLKILVEGVEYQEQATMLKQMGCDYIQGYYFHKPMSPEDASLILNDIDKKDVI
jgi:diguanylate cyclase (GGDEF)-like protein/PAS domain S-box-containing protein